MNTLKTILAWTVLVVAGCSVAAMICFLAIKAWSDFLVLLGVIGFILAPFWALGFLEKKYNPETDDDDCAP